MFYPQVILIHKKQRLFLKEDGSAKLSSRLFDLQFLYNIIVLKSGFVLIIIKNGQDLEELMKFSVLTELIQLPILETWKKKKEGEIFN